MKTIIIAAAASFALAAIATAATPPSSTLNAKPAKVEHAGTDTIELAAGPGRTSRTSTPSNGKGYSF
ncbi:hypothetical protein B0E45_29395 [Sinorhizobium sp. A49]|jgi:hypothetical protein|uniref:hypothetical protein n=1 Tax=Sinorhizobium sp. A49 TaxID=1945861 RepID=UPI0009854F1C|nr:hypothetical protein [Sinorhizobium sp. A49]OOG63619.1 hypothetical protein B0E45_29395 [Sinorhizobium sp. A49]